MPWMLIWLAIMASIIVLLWKFTKPVDRIEDDTSYLFEGRPGGRYGSKFFNILRGHGND